MLVFCDCGFHSVYPLMEKDKRLMEASWWERLTEGEAGSCSDGQGHAHTAALSAPDPAAGHRWPTPPLETPGHSGQVWVSLLWGHCSFLLGPGAHQVLFVPSKSLFPQSCVSSSSSLMGLMVTSSKRAYAIPRSAVPRASALQQPTDDLYLLRRYPNTVLSQSLGSLGPGMHKVCLNPLSVSGG